MSFNLDEYKKRHAEQESKALLNNFATNIHVDRKNLIEHVEFLQDEVDRVYTRGSKILGQMYGIKKRFGTREEDK